MLTVFLQSSSSHHYFLSHATTARGAKLLILQSGESRSVLTRYARDDRTHEQMWMGGEALGGEDLGSKENELELTPLILN
jgi:glutaredoxin-related protein